MSEEYQNLLQTDDEDSDESEATDNNVPDVPVIESEIIDEGVTFNVSNDTE
jgi:hypothetical protein